MAQDEKSIIRSLLDPKIVLDSLVMYDTDQGTEKEMTGGKTSGRKISTDLGTNYPFLTINDYVFRPEEILEMQIDNTGFIPTIQLQVQMTSTATFTSQSFPKDGDLLSVFIRAKNDAFKPIRNDYILESVDVDGSGVDGIGDVISFSGTLFVPGLMDEAVRSYEGTSYEVLQKIAKELNLGFASNDTATDDKQIWICANETYLDMIQHVTGSSWKNESSFFIAFIDVYYHLNFINVNNQFSESTKVDTSILDSLIKPEVFPSDSTQNIATEQTSAPKVLSNLSAIRSSPHYISTFKVFNNSSAVSKRYGYKTHVQFFEMNSLKYWDIYVEPLTTEGSADNKIILKGRPNKDGNTPNANFWKTQVRKRWGGIQYSRPEHNVHDKYTYAKLFNQRNTSELDKLFVSATVQRINFNVYRGERLPCILMTTGDFTRQYHERGDGQTWTPSEPQPTLDNFHSGFYMVWGYTIKYSHTGDGSLSSSKDSTPAFSQEFILKRREWPTP